MLFGLADIIIILIIAGFAFTGFWLGLIHMVGSLVGIVAAAYISGAYFDFVSSRLGFLFGGNQNLGRVTTFIIIFIFVTRLVGVLFWLINKLFHVIAIVPFVKTINRIGGALLGLFEGLVLTGLVLFLLVRYPLSEKLTSAMANSIVVDYLLNWANKVAPLLPDFVDKAKNVIS